MLKWRLRPARLSTSGRVHRGVLWTVAAAVIAAAVVGVAASRAARPKPTARQIRQQLLAELRPLALQNCTLKRYGSPNDGGYLMCGNLLGKVQSGYSYGIGPADDWGCQISRTHGVTVHQYDCFDPGRPLCPGGRTIFHDECIGPTADTVESRVFDTLTRQISRNGDADKTLVVKIDVEGAELDSLMTTSNRVLNRIDQLAMEIHGTDRRFLGLVRKLKRTFYVAHLHFNNQACASRFAPMPAWAYQVLLVNKRIGVRDRNASPPTLPHPLDAPDYAKGADCQTIGPEEP